MSKAIAIQNPFKVGDILHHQWHYTMSFPEFFKVVKVTPKTVTVVELRKRMHDNYDGYGQAGTQVPTDETYGREKKCAIRADYNGEPGALVDSYYSRVATKWDGKPKEFWGD